MLRMLIIALLFVALAPAIARAEIPQKIADIIRAEADRIGLDPVLLLVIAELESGGDPANCTGSYCGVFQLGPREFRRYGGGDIFDPLDNARAAADMIADQVDDFRAEHGRDPTWTEVYLAHQQGRGGLAAHLADPDRLAWRSMWSTAEGRARGEDWARAAIWRNVPSDRRARFGSVERITSREFVEIWRAKVERRRLALTPPAARPCRVARLTHWWEVVAP